MCPARQAVQAKVHEQLSVWRLSLLQSQSRQASSAADKRQAASVTLWVTICRQCPAADVRTPFPAEPASHTKPPEQLTVDELLNGAFLDGNLSHPTAASPMAADDSGDDSDADVEDEDMLDEAEELAEFDAAGASGEAAEESSSSDEGEQLHEWPCCRKAGLAAARL